MSALPLSASRSRLCVNSAPLVERACYGVSVSFQPFIALRAASTPAQCAFDVVDQDGQTGFGGGVLEAELSEVCGAHSALVGAKGVLDGTASDPSRWHCVELALHPIKRGLVHPTVGCAFPYLRCTEARYAGIAGLLIVIDVDELSRLRQ